jgi:CHAD domain-containing protein
MPKAKNWEIPSLSPKKDLDSSAKIILGNRLNRLLDCINSYFLENNAENLHEIRISLRRVRYPMELFIKCFNRKKYLDFYKLLSQTQDLSGSVRDLDVLEQNLINFFKDDKSSLVKFNKIINNKNELQSILKLELMKLIHSKELKEFKKLISHRN